MSLELDPDRLFPVDRQTRTVARNLYERVAELPIISPHGHVDPEVLRRDEAFPDPADLLLSRDHYITRLLHAAGAELTSLGVGRAAGADPRAAWRIFCTNWHLFAGTASGYWLMHQLVTLFEAEEEPSAENADRLFDRIAARLGAPGFLPRELFERFRIEVLATTDDPLDDLSSHAALASDPSFRGRVLPTFRPDAYTDPENPLFRENVERLAAHAGSAPGNYRAYIEALEDRRRYFIQHGAVSADHGVREPLTVDLDDSEAAKLFKLAMQGGLSAEEARVFSGSMLFQMARMSVSDGLVMTIHPGVYRNHSSGTLSRFGSDTGHDIPVGTTFTENLRPMLEKFGLEKDLHIVLFAVDETVYSREIAPLAGFYPSLYIGAPWWFLDAPDAVQRFRSAVTETAGFYRGSGFIDDTRAFLSIPARHDMARRLDSAFIARLVAEGRISRPMAERLITDVTDSQPRKVFKL
ncbi:glucuronate isomerase [Lysobacter korlensis]|uniref:Uronate isomerase n=1 Tax=Lysobacter korlensis TaxID=553636 RepID=A0ABV6RX33_9GAMM